MFEPFGNGGGCYHRAGLAQKGNIMRSAVDWKRVVVATAALAAAVAGGTRVWAQPVNLDQGWNKQTSDAFWFNSQGSRIMPYSWFIGLEQAESTNLLSDVNFLEGLGFIGVEGQKLPIGFAVDRNQSRTATYIGLTCAACHTGRLNIEGRPVLVEGGPALADFSALLNALVAATTATLKDDQAARFERFAARVNVPASGHKELRRQLTELNVELTKRHDQNAPAEAYGFGRVDAFGHIFNRVFSTALEVEENRAVADAPVSYPFLWDTPDPMHERVQWNWSAPNAGFGDEARNIGELLGVFGYFDLKKPGPFGAPYYPKTSVDVRKLVRLETLIKSLRSPVWPSGLSANMAIDRAAAAQGKTVYDRNCQRCHALIDRAEPGRKAHDRLVPINVVGTDSTMTDNHARRLSDSLKTGLLAGRKKVPSGTFGDRATGRDILGHVLAGVLAGQLGHQDRAAPTSTGAPPPPPPPPVEDAPQKGYKARSLNGIWATAPYLHNGSVPTLADLLSEQRVGGFWISSNRYDHKNKVFFPGSNKFDPKNVGLATEQSDGAFWFDTTKPGNRNTGHPFGTNLQPQEKLSLIEFLKTL
jgi:hypothetical protein